MLQYAVSVYNRQSILFIYKKWVIFEANTLYIFDLSSCLMKLIAEHL